MAWPLCRGSDHRRTETHSNGPRATHWTRHIARPAGRGKPWNHAACLLLEELWRELVKVLAPDLPLMGTGDLKPDVLDAGRLHGLMRRFHGSIAAVLSAAAQPEQADLLIGGRRILKQACERGLG